MFRRVIQLSIIILMATVMFGCALRVHEGGYSINAGMPEYSEENHHLVQGTVVGIEVTPLSESAMPKVLLGYGRYVLYRGPAAIAEGDEEPTVSLSTVVGSGDQATVRETLGIGRWTKPDERSERDDRTTDP